jgi:hypothetical protein
MVCAGSSALLYGKKLRTVVLFEPMSEASANRTSIRLGSFGRVSARRELLLHDITFRRKAAGELPLLLGRQID